MNKLQFRDFFETTFFDRKFTRTFVSSLDWAPDLGLATRKVDGVESAPGDPHADQAVVGGQELRGDVPPGRS